MWGVIGGQKVKTLLKYLMQGNFKGSHTGHISGPQSVHDPYCVFSISWYRVPYTRSLKVLKLHKGESIRHSKQVSFQVSFILPDSRIVEEFLLKGGRPFHSLADTVEKA